MRGAMRLGVRGGMQQLMPDASDTGVMPPNFGYPFYQPPSLLSPSSSGRGHVDVIAPPR